MQFRAFHFALGPRKSWAQSHPSKHPRVTLTLTSGGLGGVAVDTMLTMSAAEARAMAVALEAAATHAENTLPTGLGESEAA